MPFLEVLTRHYKRPSMLGVNRASLQAQDCDDWVQTILVDDVGRGVAWANGNLANYAPEIVGEYVWILDDDDECIRPTLVSELKSLAGEWTPDVIMIRMDHGVGMGVLPDTKHWGKRPECGYIGVSAFVVRREVWQRHAAALASGRYEADYDFITSIFDEEGLLKIWHDVVASRVQRISRGAAE